MSNEINVNLGNIIKMARIKKNLSQEELGKFLKVTGSLVSRWESNKRIPEVDTLYKLVYLL